MLHGISPAQADDMEVWKLAAALGQHEVEGGDTAPQGATGGPVDPWGDSPESRAELLRRRVNGEPIPPPPPTPITDLLGSAHFGAGPE